MALGQRPWPGSATNGWSARATSSASPATRSVRSPIAAIVSGSATSRPATATSSHSSAPSTETTRTSRVNTDAAIGARHGRHRRQGTDGTDSRYRDPARRPDSGARTPENGTLALRRRRTVRPRSSPDASVPPPRSPPARLQLRRSARLVETFECQAPGKRAADLRVREVGAVRALERALEALPTQGIGPQHMERVLLVGDRVVEERHTHAAGRDLAVDALDVAEHPGRQLLLIRVLAREPDRELLDQLPDMRERLVRARAQPLQAVGVDHDELPPGRREPRPGKPRAGERNGYQVAAGLVLIVREPGRPLQHRARRAADRAGGALGDRHRLKERLGMANHAAAEIAARDDYPAMIVRAAHRIRGEPSRVGVVLKRVEGLVADDRLADRKSWRADRKLEHR